jgi:hypothetical protein
MQTVYSWACPKCGKQYVNGSEPTYCDQSFFLKLPGDPRADADTGLVETKCGAPILPLTPRHVSTDASNCPGPISEEYVSDEAAAAIGPIMETVIRVLKSRDWRYARYAEHPMLEFSLGCKHASIRMVVTAREKEQQVIVYAMMSPKVPEARRAAVAEFFARVNYTFFIGGFDLDVELGGVRFRAGYDVEGGALTEKMVENLFDMTSHAADAHHERLMQVIYGGVEPKAALEGEAK